MFAVKYMSKQVKHIKNVLTTVKIFQNNVTYVGTASFTYFCKLPKILFLGEAGLFIKEYKTGLHEVILPLLILKNDSRDGMFIISVIKT